MQTEKVAYGEGGTELEAHVVRPRQAGPRPVVLVSHAWAGQTDFERDRAAQLAELGYVGFALDNYGKGVVGNNNDECGALMTPFLENRKALQSRLLAGYEAAKALAGVDPTRVAAIGFCFGGLCVLDLARSGAALRGVVSFHGLFRPSGLPPQKIQAKVLALHGYDDPMVRPDAVQALAHELGEAGADWQIHMYGGTMHAFTNPQANDPGFGTVYSKAADARSFEAMKAFLAEALA
jgi:dienelactone hydrolase